MWRKLFPVILLSALQLQAAAPQFQFNSSVSQRFDYGFEAAFATETRLASSGQALREFEVTPELIWHYSPHWDFSIGYDGMENWDKERIFMRQDLAFASATLRLQLGKELNFSNRGAFEFGSDNSNQSVLLVRNLTRLGYTGQVLPYRLKPYISNEVYWQLEPTNEIIEDRLALGVNYTLNRATTLNFFTMLDDLETTKELVPVMGVGITIVF